MSNVGGTDPAPGRATEAPSRWSRRLLIGSLALNLLFLGTLAGGYLAARHRHSIIGPHARPTLMGYVASLPTERRDAIWKVTRAHFQSLRAARKEARKARKAIDEALVAEPFDKARLSAAQAALIDVEGRTRGPFVTMIVELATSMTLEERSAFVKWRDRGHAHRRPHWPPMDEGESAQQPPQPK